MSDDDARYEEIAEAVFERLCPHKNAFGECCCCMRAEIQHLWRTIAVVREMNAQRTGAEP